MADFGLPASFYRPLATADVDRMANAAFDVLERSGVAVYSPTALAAFADAGARVDTEKRTAYLSRSLVEDAIDSNPSSVTLYSRDGELDARLEGSRVHYGTGGTAINVLDPETGEHRPSRVEDVILNARLVDELDNIHVFTINVFPNDIDDTDQIDTNRFFHALDNTTKHVMGGVYSLEGCKKVVAMAEAIAGGADALRAKPFVSFITLVISPFKIDEVYGEMTCYLTRKGLPVVVPTEPLCGTTAPITLAANVLVHVTETLAGIALVQCLQKGAPGICGSVGSITDLRTLGHLSGAIERRMINAAVSQMAQHFELPLYSTAGTSDAKEVDLQAAYESGMSNLLVAMSGANYIHDAAGLMDFDLTVAYEKLVMDDEILGMCQRVLRGIEVDDDKLALDLIFEKGPAQDYLGEEHTVRHMRQEFSFPKLANREPREMFRRDDDALARAKKKVEEVRSRPAESKLDAAVRAKLVADLPEIRAVETAARLI